MSRMHAQAEIVLGGHRRHSRRRWLFASSLALLLAAACGGGGGGSESAGGSPAAPSPSPSPAPAPTPTPAPAPTKIRLEGEPVAYWVQGAGLRPNLAHLLPTSPGSGTAVALGVGETAWLDQRVAQAQGSNAKPTTPAAALQAAVQRRTVTGLQTSIFHRASGSDVQPQNLTARVIEAYAPNGLGGFELIPATARRADGTYAINGVPEGPHWVRLGTSWVWTSEPFIDWSFDFFGRSDVEGGLAATFMQFNAGNLAPWQASDNLAWVVPEQGASLPVPLTDPNTSNAPRVGETALGAFTFDIGLFTGLLDAAKGDRAYLNQLVTQPATGVRTLGRSLVLPPTTTASGSTTPINSAFLDVAQSARLRLRFQRSVFAAEANAVFPGATLSSTVWGLSAFALPPSLGTPFDAFSLVEFNTTGSSDLDFGTLAYGNPFPSDWNRVLDGFVAFTKNYLAPGATVSEPLVRGLSVSVLLDPANRDHTQVTATPGLTPPRRLLINGKSLLSNQLAVGTSPTLSWSTPTTGVPDRYSIRVLELRANGTRSQFLTRARLLTADTTMTLPPGILQTGSVYVFTIAAVKTDRAVTDANRGSLPLAFATAMTAIVAP